MKKALILFCLLSAIDVYAHEFNPAHLVINQVEGSDSNYEVTWMYPFKNIGKRAEVIFPKQCSSNSEDLFYQGKYLKEKITLQCTDTLKGSKIEIISLSVLTDALVTINFLDDTFEGLVNVQSNVLEIPLETQYYPSSYLILGISHLFDGLDHILFIFGLLFCITGLINIIKTITAFTVAHSITLGLTIFDIIKLPQGTVEALIALTIVYLATEITRDESKLKSPWIMAFCFGLLHGLGFALSLIHI